MQHAAAVLAWEAMMVSEGTSDCMHVKVGKYNNIFSQKLCKRWLQCSEEHAAADLDLESGDDGQLVAAQQLLQRHADSLLGDVHL